MRAGTLMNPSVIGFVVALVIYCSGPPMPATTSGATEEDSSAAAVLQRVDELYSEINSASVRVRYGLQSRDGSVDFQHDATVYLRRPNQVRVDVPHDAGPVVCDGDHLYAVFRTIDRYLVVEAPPTLQDLAQNPALVTAGGAVTRLVSSLFAFKSSDRILRGARSIAVLEDVTLDGHKYRRLELRSEDVLMEVWVATGVKPFVRRIISFDLDARAAREPSTMPSRPKEGIVIAMDDWRVEPEFTAEDFKFSPPAGSTAVNSVDQLFAMLRATRNRDK